MEIKASEKFNRLIAEFMGYKTLNIPADTIYQPNESSLYSFAFDNTVYEKDAFDYHLTLHYHTSWDWLMPVVERIEKESHVYFDIYREATRVRYQPQETTLWKAMCPDENCKINHVYNAVIQFIEWYNTTHPLTP